MAIKQPGARTNRHKKAKPAKQTEHSPVGKMAIDLPAVESIDELPERAGYLRRTVIMRMQKQQGNTAVLHLLGQSQNANSLPTPSITKSKPQKPGKKVEAQAAVSTASLAGDHIERHSSQTNQRPKREPIPTSHGLAPGATIQKTGIADKAMAGVVQQFLKQAAAIVGMIPDDMYGPLTTLAKAGLHGFLKRLAAIPVLQLVKMARGVIAAIKSPQYILGFLIGLLKGFFVDGLAGIFVLLYDLGKLAVKLQSFGFRVAKFLGTAAVNALSADISGLGKWLAENAPTLAKAVLQELGGKGGLMGSVAQVAGFLMKKAKGAASKIGGKIAGGLINLLSQSKKVLGRALGEMAGRLSGAALFEILLAIATSGGGSAITAVKNGARAILSLLGKIGRGIMAVIGPLGKWIARATSALKGWVTALVSSSRLKGIGTKLEQLLEKLGNFIKTIMSRIKARGKAGGASTKAGTGTRVPSEGLPAPASLPRGAKTTTEGLPAPASLPRGARLTGGGRAAKASSQAGTKVPGEGLPAPASLPRGAKTTTEGLPAPASLPKAAAVKFTWPNPGEALSFAHDWIVKWGGKFVEYVNHRKFVEDWRILGRTDDPPAAFVNARNELILDGTRMDIPKAWHARGREGSAIPRGGTGGPSGPRGTGAGGSNTPTLPPF